MLKTSNNYIHYFWYHYLRYGLKERPPGDDFKFGGTFLNPIEIFDDQKNRILSSLKAETKRNKYNTEALEEQLNKIFNISKSKDIIDSEKDFLENVRAGLIKFFNENGMRLRQEVEQKFLESGRIITDAAGIQGMPTSIENSDLKRNMRNLKILEKTKSGEGSKQHTYKTFQKAINTFNRIYEIYTNNMVKEGNYVAYEQLKANIEQINTAFKNLQEQSGIIQEGANKNTKNLYEAYRRILNSWQTNRSAEAAGVLGENLTAILTTEAGNLAANSSAEAVYNFLNNIQNSVVIGQKTSQKALINIIPKAEIDKRNSNFKIQTHTKSYNIKDPRSGVTATLALVSNHKTQEKIDVILNWPGFRGITASVKNYGRKSSGTTMVSLHSGRSLYQMTQLDSNFASHYLNVMSTHGAWKKGEKKNLSSYRRSAIEAMKVTVALRSLMGGMLVVNENGRLETMKNVNLFIINDSNTGKFQVKTIDYIINNIINNIDLFQLKPNLDNVRYDNRWVGSKGRYDAGNAAQRLSNVLSQFHAHKIKASISWNAID